MVTQLERLGKAAESFLGEFLQNAGLLSFVNPA